MFLLRQKVRQVLGIPQRSFASQESIIEKIEKYAAHNYGPIPIVIERGERCFLYDTDGNKYTDFMAGYSSCNQGHCHPELVKTMFD